MVIYILYELSCQAKLNNNAFLDTTIFYIIPYGVVSYLGHHFLALGKNRKSIICISLLLFTVMTFIFFRMTGSFQNVQIAKYPPRLYYLSYGVFFSMLLMYLGEINNSLLPYNKFISFISRHSMWIYLWHIVFIEIYNCFLDLNLWYIEYVFVYLLSVLMVYAMNVILDKLEKHDSMKKYLKYFR